MRMTVVKCDRCGDVVNDNKAGEGATSVYVKIEGFNCVATTIINCKDFCNGCLSHIIQSIKDSVKL